MRARRSSRKPETGLQISLVEFFEAHIDPADAMIFAVNQGDTKLTPQHASLLKAMGVRSGVSDLVILMRGPQTVLVEVKMAAYFDPLRGKRVPAGTLNDNQEKFMKRVVAWGFRHYVVHDGEEFAAMLRELGLLRTGARPRPNHLPWVR